MKWAHLHFSRFTFFSVFVCFFFTLLFTSNVSAVSDYSYTWVWSSHSSYVLCGSDSDRNCSDFIYIVFEPSGSCTGNGAGFYVYGLGSLNNSIVPLCSKSIFPISQDVIRLTGGTNIPSNYSGGDITITLTNSLCSVPSGSLNVSENGTYNVTDYAQVVVDVPLEVVPGDYHDDLSAINSSIIVCGAIVLVIYFFYCIYRMIIKNTGVS